ncbi:MAG: aldose 1-epimerase family protein [Micromonosporaceae bacterium]
MGVAPSGEQFPLVAGDHRATVVEVGGGIREYTVDGRDVLDPYPVTAVCDGAHGAPLIPWPNRLGDGRYTFDGVEHQLALTEPEKHNAIHGLTRWRSWRAVEREPDRVVMACRLHPQPGYPFSLDLRVEYTLGEDGLVVRTTATNVGDTPCPYGCGQHPYLSPGDGLIDDCVLQVRAGTWIDTANERQLPTGRHPTRGSPLDFSDGRRLGDQRLDFPFTDLSRDPDGRAWVRLTGADGASAELWVDEAYPIVELYTGDTLAPQRRRRGLGTEPMSCPPDAFRSGEGVIRLAPGESTTASWGARLR